MVRRAVACIWHPLDEACCPGGRPISAAARGPPSRQLAEQTMDSFPEPGWPVTSLQGGRRVIFEQYFLSCLSQASYLVGDETTGRAVVVDPRRDVSDDLTAAARHGLHIEHVIETHVHADFVSGHLELAAATGADICFGQGATTEFPARLLGDRERISLGEVSLEIGRRPGTPRSPSASWSTSTPPT